MKKVLVQLDLDYLIDPETILAYSGTKKYTDPGGADGTGADACIIYSPFVWLYYRCKEIIQQGDMDDALHEYSDDKQFKIIFLLKMIA